MINQSPKNREQPKKTIKEFFLSAQLKDLFLHQKKGFFLFFLISIQLIGIKIAQRSLRSNVVSLGTWTIKETFNWGSFFNKEKVIY